MCSCSIVVPVFNTQSDLLFRCVQSLSTQSAGDYEVLLVDDGSDLATVKALEQVERTFKCVRVIYRDHEGAAATRAAGVREAKGKYIAFVDSDDEVFPEYLEEAIEAMEKLNLDIVWGGIADYLDGVVQKSHSIDGECLLFEGEGVERALRYIVSGGCPKDVSCLQRLGSKAMVAKLYKRQLFDSDDFPRTSLVFGEDVYVNFSVSLKAKRIAVVPYIWYRRNVNAGSTSYSYHPRGIEEALESGAAIAELAGPDNALKNAALTRILSCISLGFETQIANCSVEISFGEKKEVIRRIFSNPWVKEACENVDLGTYCSSGTWSAILLAYKLRTPGTLALLFDVRQRIRERRKR